MYITTGACDDERYYRQRFLFLSQIFGNFYVCRNDFQIIRFDNREQLFSFFQSLFLIAGSQADTFAFLIDLITEVVSAAFFSLIDGAGFQLDTVQIGILFFPCHQHSPLKSFTT